MRKLILLLAYMVSVATLAQQLPQYNQWATQLFLVNPATTGSKGAIEINTIYRTQWLGFEGAPASTSVGFHGPIRIKSGTYLGSQHGWGIRFESDKIGAFSSNRANLNYAIHLNLTETKRMSFGCNLGLLQTGYDPTNAITIDPDPTVTRSSVFVLPDASFGWFLHAKDYFFGLTLQNALGGTWKNIGFASNYGRHILVQNGFKFKLNNQFHILPQISLRSDFHAPLTAQFQAMVDYKTIIRAGFGYRTGDAMIFLGSWNLSKRFALCYTFDYGISNFYAKNLFSHELGIRFNAGKLELIKVATCSLFD